MQTILPALCRRVPLVTTQRERLVTPDGDFIDLDWARRGANRLAILSHGLEGSSRQSYMQGMAGALARRGWDVLAWSFRGCSGEPNRLARSYHSGASEDLALLIDHIRRSECYASVGLVGFSLGGNLMLKFLGEQAAHLPGEICGAVAFSVPCDLAGSAARLALPGNALYMRRFLRTLREKIRGKAAAFPELINIDGLEQISTFAEFDDRFTAPLHGFRNAAEYWERCSCRAFLPHITVPTLLVNAANDPFLVASCYPWDEARASARFHLEVPSSGGHVGFLSHPAGGEYWSEVRAAAFLGLAQGGGRGTHIDGIRTRVV